MSWRRTAKDSLELRPAAIPAGIVRHDDPRAAFELAVETERFGHPVPGIQFVDGMTKTTPTYRLSRFRYWEQVRHWIQMPCPR
uniref:Uncharacterized protein n=1 Tax=Thermocrispum agreste TaxID=37925 RepID=A0A2W4JPG9_9PSEU|nr:MAG: hypothetical protein DIU77_04095 [Thermocrispum agreste]